MWCGFWVFLGFVFLLCVKRPSSSILMLSVFSMEEIQKLGGVGGKKKKKKVIGL